MTVGGHIYGVVLNDRAELDRLAPDFETKPYAAAPRAPVVYMKPRAAIATGPVRAAHGETLRAASTLALLFARDAAHCSADTALSHVGAAALALDLSRPQPSYYRPAVGFANGDGFLVLGDWDALTLPPAIDTTVDEAHAHGWSLDRLLRDPARLIADLSSFMTLRAGDVLLVGLPGDAPQVSAGQSVKVTALGLPPLTVRIEEASA